MREHNGGCDLLLWADTSGRVDRTKERDQLLRKGRRHV